MKKSKLTYLERFQSWHCPLPANTKVLALAFGFLVSGSVCVSASAAVSPESNVAQQKSTAIRGVVTDASGEPLVGVTVAAVGTKKATVTDVNGKFSIDVAAGSKLKISYIGYTAQEVAASSRGEMNIVLKEDSKSIDEVVVTALGIRREKKALGYAIQEP